MFASGSLVIRPNCSSKSFHWIFFWQEKFEFETTQVIKVNKLLWFDKMTITTPTHGLQRIKGLYFFPSYTCSSLFSHLVSKPMMSAKLFSKSFHWNFFCKKRSACIASFPMQKKKSGVWSFGSVVASLGQYKFNLFPLIAANTSSRQSLL